MAEIDVSLRASAAFDAFPPVCVYCGAPATQTLEFHAKMGPEHGFEVITTRWPICQRDFDWTQSFHRVAHRIQFGLLFGSVLLGLLSFWLYRYRQFEEFGKVFLGLAGASFVGVFVLHFVRGLAVGLEVLTIKEDVATITGVGDKFAAALMEWRRRPRPPEQPFWQPAAAAGDVNPFAFNNEPIQAAAPVAEAVPIGWAQPVEEPLPVLEATECLPVAVPIVQPVVAVRPAAPLILDINIEQDSQGQLQGSGRAIWNDAGVTLTRPNLPAFFVPRGAAATMIGNRLRLVHDQRQIEISIGQGVADAAGVLRDLAAFLRGEGPRRQG